jgi:methionyl-tRNA formyltransferase
MKKFVLFINKGTGIELLKHLIKNRIHPELVLTQTPYDSYCINKNKFIKIKYFLSRIIHRKNYLELYDVYFLCRKNKIEVISEKYTNDAFLIEKCKQLNVNLGIIFTYGTIIKKKIIDSFSQGIINYHPSLLPSHRGIDPLFWTIYNEEEYSGITFHFIDESIDKGVILFQKQYKLRESESVASLGTTLSKIGADELLYYLQKEKFREFDLQGINFKIEESYESGVTENFFCIDENSSSEKIRKLFKACFSTYKPYIQMGSEKIEFSRYEIISENSSNISDKNFVINRSDKYFDVNTSDNRIIKLYI